MAAFASVLLSGEAAGLGQEARQDIKRAVSQEDTQTRFGFKRINGTCLILEAEDTVWREG